MIDPNLLTLIALLVGFLVNWLKEGRQHRWEAEERERLAAEARHDIIIAEQRITKHIESNTDISTKAFHEANSVNLKLHALGLENLARTIENAHDASKP